MRRWVITRAASPDMQRAADVALGVALAVFAQLDLRFNLDNSTHYGSDFASAVSAGIATLAVCLRRRAPLACVGLVAAAVAGPEIFTRQTVTLWGGFVPMLIALYSVARHGSRRAASAGAVIIALAAIAVMLRVPAVGTAGNIPFTFVPFAVAFVGGRVLGRRQLSHAAAAARAERLEADREATVRAAINEERGRIARELHDIVAHCVSVMVVQAGAAEDLLDRRPADARVPLRSVQETGRQAVAELGRMLNLLRGDRDSLSLRPQPDIAAIAELVKQMQDVGLTVGVLVDGTPRPLAPGVELTVYRVVQEALTNVLKHAGAARACVRLSYHDHRIEVEISDDGAGGAAVPGVGHGLVGMRERISIYGGSLRAGAPAEGGYAVHASLPLTGDPE